MESNCENCGEKIVGTKKKKFCNDICRATYHNSVRENEATEKRKLKISYKGNLIEIEINNTLITYNQSTDTTSVTAKKIKK